MSTDNKMRSLLIVMYLATADHNWLESLDPVDLPAASVLEPEELFIKPEMHTRKKASSKQWSLALQRSVRTDNVPVA